MTKIKENVDTMVLGAGHSILVSHAKYNGITPQQASDKFFEVNKTTKESVDMFGLFGGSNNYHTFYPDAKPEQFNPKEDEFIEPMFRLLSACIVSKNYNPTEFPEDVLKASLPLLVGQTVNCDHETDVANAIGVVKEVVWQKAYSLNGVQIPAGINGILKIDGISNPRIVRGIYMDPPSIHSNSVTVQFEWKPSHTFEKAWEFYDKLGTIAEDGQMVRRIATRIISYKETSLVSHGADPFAQLLKNNKINNPQYANAVYYSFSDSEPIAEKDLSKHLSFFDFKGGSEVSIMHNTSKPDYEGNIINQNKSNNMNELEKFLEKLFGEGMLSLSEGQTITSELAFSTVQELVQNNKTLTEEKNSLSEQLTKSNDELASLKAEQEKNAKMITIGTNHLSEVRQNAIASYKKLFGEDKVDQNIISLLESETTNLETLISLKATYESQLEEKFPLHCSKCGSHDVTRASSAPENENDEIQNSEEVAGVAGSIRKIAKSKLR